MNGREKSGIGIGVSIASIGTHAFQFSFRTFGMDIYADQHTRHIHLPTLSSKQQQQQWRIQRERKKAMTAVTANTKCNQMRVTNENICVI